MLQLVALARRRPGSPFARCAQLHGEPAASRRLCGLAPVQRRAASRRTDTPRALLPIGASPTSRHTVSRPSLACASRSQVVSGSARNARAGTSATSSATTANPPARTIRSSARIACVHRALDHRPAARPRRSARVRAPRAPRSRSTPAAAADDGIEAIERIDQRHDVRRARWPPPASRTTRSSGRTTRRRRAPRLRRAAIRRPATRRARRCPSDTDRPRRPSRIRPACTVPSSFVPAAAIRADKCARRFHVSLYFRLTGGAV